MQFDWVFFIVLSVGVFVALFGTCQAQSVVCHKAEVRSCGEGEPVQESTVARIHRRDEDEARRKRLIHFRGAPRA
jgi:hypothetical protein